MAIQSFIPGTKSARNSVDFFASERRKESTLLSLPNPYVLEDLKRVLQFWRLLSRDLPSLKPTGNFLNIGTGESVRKIYKQIEIAFAEVERL